MENNNPRNLPSEVKSPSSAKQNESDLPEIDIDDLLNIAVPSSDAKPSAENYLSDLEKYYARSSKRGEGLFELKEIAFHRTVKGVKGREYYCVWADEHAPTWEKESLIKCE